MTRRRRIPTWAAIVLLAMSLAACRRAEDPLDRPSILATIDGRTVERDTFDRFARARLGPQAELASAEALSGLFDQLVEEEIVASHAISKGSAAPNGPAARRAAVEAFLARAAAEAPPVEEAEVSAWYAAHPERSRLPERVVLRQWLFRTPAEADDALRRLAAGETFDSISKHSSAAPNADRGGRVGTIVRGQLPPEFEEVVFRLKPGVPSKPVPAPSGVHVFLVESHEPERVLALAEVRGAVRQELERERAEARAARAVAAAVGSARVELALDHFPFRYRGRWNGGLPIAPPATVTSAGETPR